MPYTEASGARVAFQDSRPARHAEPTFLMLPGWCETSAVFEPLAERLERRRRVVRLDWRGHGASGRCDGDYGTGELLADALAVVEASRAREVVPVASAHAGWVAIELARRLGPRVTGLALLDWLVLDPPAAFVQSLRAMTDPVRWGEAREQLFEMWVGLTGDPRVRSHIERDMRTFGYPTWSRAAREVAASYAEAGSPLEAIAALPAPPPTLHVYAQPRHEAFLAAQRAFAARHPWFHVRRIAGGTHFACLESPAEVASAIERLPSLGEGAAAPGFQAG